MTKTYPTVPGYPQFKYDEWEGINNPIHTIDVWEYDPNHAKMIGARLVVRICRETEIVVKTGEGTTKWYASAYIKQGYEISVRINGGTHPNSVLAMEGLKAKLLGMLDEVIPAPTS